MALIQSFPEGGRLEYINTSNVIKMADEITIQTGSKNDGMILFNEKILQFKVNHDGWINIWIQNSNTALTAGRHVISLELNGIPLCSLYENNAVDTWSGCFGTFVMPIRKNDIIKLIKSDTNFSSVYINGNSSKIFIAN